MKRSEMLDKLEKAMHEAEGAHPWSLAEIALKVVEEEGMQPPKYYSQKDGEVYSQWEQEELC